MRKVLRIGLIVLIIIALILGISAGDLWNYIVDFSKIAVAAIVQWITVIIGTIKDTLKNSTNGSEQAIIQAFYNSSVL